MHPQSIEMIIWGFNYTLQQSWFWNIFVFDLLLLKCLMTIHDSDICHSQVNNTDTLHMNRQLYDGLKYYGVF